MYLGLWTHSWRSTTGIIFQGDRPLFILTLYIYVATRLIGQLARTCYDVLST